jgi:hypothetical protein
MVEDFDAHQEQPQPQVPPPTKPKSNTKLLIIIIVAVVLLCCCVTFLVIWFSGDFLLDLIEELAFLGFPLLM